MKQKDIKEKIKKYFFINPNSKLRVREIERILKIPLPSVIRYCKDLEKERILIINKIGNVVFYMANKSGSQFLLEKRMYNVLSLYHSGLIDFLKSQLSNPSIILFGSYSKGEDIETSDIDLYIETPSKKEINLKDYEKKLKKNIQIFKYKSIQDIKNKELGNNIINGINLNGFIEILK